MSQPSRPPSEIASPVAYLFQAAREKGFLTFDDILAVIPQPEKSLDQLDQLFGALIAAKIPFGDDDVNSYSSKGDKKRK